MAFYDEMAVMALELITEFGQSVTIRDIAKGGYDPSKGGTAPDTVTERTAQGILLDFTGQEFQTNTLIKVGDKKLKIAARGLSEPPTLLSKVVVQGRTWSIIPPLKEINPAGTPLLYELQVRS
ncbi:hypothetical protein IBL38_08280 [Pseudomonas syringae pv. syringae]|uniref:hypothetical protein n=1 Tax=Pseudomonas syringae group TaxID=136849 RepID=UPI000F001B2B|nr:MULTISPECIES: hypothetical protein [Pseudomonas syringae group]MBC9743284.1 hypothetical protein [Pseudomonas syringae pv. syringae]MBC9747295.1 hypothetical protein [Pseudomonas syringae pv. syringae]MCK9720918.1 hypothetical protein [Pseudomonas syringae pv. syringae]RMP22184.1 hypothetical protein ALQ25_01753 [Pseudomonas coronafaciens pv. atropurpurea]